MSPRFFIIHDKTQWTYLNSIMVYTPTAEYQFLVVLSYSSCFAVVQSLYNWIKEKHIDGYTAKTLECITPPTYIWSKFFSALVVLLSFISRFALERQQINSNTKGTHKKVGRDILHLAVFFFSSMRDIQVPWNKEKLDQLFVIQSYKSRSANVRVQTD